NNGGATLTIALLPGNSAINTGDNSNCPATDQRGVTRPQGGTCDIGAYEYQFIAPTISAAFSPNPVALDTPSTLTLTISNPNASTPLTGVAFSDSLPTGPGAMVVASPNGLTTSGCGTPTVSADPGSANITFSVGTISGPTCTVSVNVTESTLGTYSDVSSVVTASEISGTTTASASLTVNQVAADLSVTNAVATSYTPGSPLTFTIVVTNSAGSPNAAPNVTLNDVWTPSQFTAAGMSWTCAAGPGATCPAPGTDTTGNFTTGAFTLPANIADTFTVTGTVAGTTTDAISNTASVGSPSIVDPTPANNTATAMSGKPHADLAVTNSAASTYAPGSTLTYTIVASNAGPNSANNVTLNDMWTPAQFTGAGLSWTCVAVNGATCPAASGTDTSGNFITGQFSLPLGGTATFTLAGTVASGVSSAISNIATVASTATSDSNMANNTATATSSAASADLAVTKSGPGSVLAGSNITYTIAISNNGPDTAQSVSLTDTLPANTTFVSEAQSAGPTFACTNPAVGATGTITCTANTLANGASASFSVVLNVNSATPDATTLTNSASVISSTGDPNTANNTATSSGTVVAKADLQVTKTGPSSAYPGQNISYTITVSNTGPLSAQAVSLTDNVPANTTFVSESQSAGPAFNCSKPAINALGTVKCTLSTLAVGASATFSVVVKLNASVADNTTITNTATATETTTDPNPANNHASATTNVQSHADLSVTNRGPAQTIPGSSVSYTVIAHNAGPNAARSVTLSDTVPTNMTFVSAAQTVGPAFLCSRPPVGGTGTLHCTLGSLVSGQTAIFTVVLEVNNGLANGTLLTNTASVSATTADPNSANNTSSATTVISIQADLAVKASGPATAPPGGTVSYSITLTNSGPDSAQSVTLTDNLPATNISFVSEAQTGGPAFVCTKPAAGGTGAVTCTLASFASGATATFTIVAKVKVGTAANTILKNTASVTSANTDPNGGNNSASVSTTVS
ncbi:MAG TPA: choice-of-anchor Q domain-containing protein, partial [Aggregatilineales bacterium]|nr:choice-of-anchor Q domain-containing protein [Aggregatilineales bacterium]